MFGNKCASTRGRWTYRIVKILIAFSFNCVTCTTILKVNYDSRIDNVNVSISSLNEESEPLSQHHGLLSPSSHQRLQNYLPNWPSLDSRPLPRWYDEAKIGIFIHWGVFSVPALNDAWFWNCWKEKNPECVDFMKKNYRPDFTYQDFASEFTAEFFNATDFATLFKKSGARYVVLTSKHHDGFTLFPSKRAFGWNAMDVGPRRDIVGKDGKCKLTTLLPSQLLRSWLGNKDKANGYKTDEFVKFKILPELQYLIETYKPEILWSDGDWDAPDVYWQSKEFLSWLYNSSPVKDTIVSNDRWGQGIMCHHGGFLTCQDRYNPGVLQPRKWENCMTLDKQSWGYRRNANFIDYLSPEQLIASIVETVACGGNILVNVGPTKEGTIIPIQQERLLQMGEWLETNGEAVYSTIPWNVQNDTVTHGVWYTYSSQKSRVYAMITQWPQDSQDAIFLKSVEGPRVSEVTLLGHDGKLAFQNMGHNNGVFVKLPCKGSVRSKWAWVLGFQVV